MLGSATAPDVATIHAEVHPVGRSQWALQFIREAGRTRRGGSLFASRDPGLFAGVESVTLGVP